MTIQQFDRAVQLASFKDGDRKWFPKWIRAYALFHNTSESEPLLLDRERVVAYLRHLRDKGTQAWQRKQAAKALQTYQNLLIRQELVQFQPILAKLDELVARERRAGTSQTENQPRVLGEGNHGKILADLPEPIQQLRMRMRFLHHPISTENTYAQWLTRFLKHLEGKHPKQAGEREIADFLSEMALTGQVSGGTQNVALSSLLFYYEKSRTCASNDERFWSATAKA